MVAPAAVDDDFLAGVCARVRNAAPAGQALRIRGGGTKDFYGASLAGDVLEMGSYAGIVAYEPRELVLTVRAGTALADVEAALAAERQLLPFEPPRFGAGATIGGTVACGLSGPRRPYAGAVRDFVLGARVVNGRGEHLAFGGRVIKNVAGYDVSRLMAGAFGTLGILTELSFKVLPKPPAERTLGFALGESAAIAQTNLWAGQPLPLSATAWCDGELRVRLSGAEVAVAAAHGKMGGEVIAGAEAFWADLREHHLPFFAADRPLWRLSVPPAALPLPVSQPQLIEWGGALRWVSGELDAHAIRACVERAGGHATLFRGTDKAAGVFHPLQPGVAKLHRRLKAAFDPAGILNPGRLYDFAA